MKADPQEVRKRFERLKEQRTGWEPLWKDIRDYILPDFGVFDGEDPASGGKRYQRIVDSTATQAADVLAAGLLTGVSSPSRPWLKLTTLDPELDDSPDVKQWLSELQNRMLQVFAKADVYNSLHQSYLELPAFGQACTVVRPHSRKVLNVRNQTVGQYWFSEDPYGIVDTLYRRIDMTAKQMVQQWGIDAVSSTVRSVYESDPFRKFKVIHAIEPRFERDDMKHDNLNKPFRSVYFEEDDSHSILSESGYSSFPAMCPRWMTCGDSQYGRGPGAKALSASKSLQQMQTRMLTLIDYLTDPPVLYPDTYADDLDLFRPGGRIPASVQEADIFRSAWQVTTNPQSLLELINARRDEINRLFYVNVFQMVAQTVQPDRTAYEVAALEQEKVLMLGPVLERLHSELLDPLVSTTFDIMVEQDLIPDPPEEIRGKSLSVEYISVLAEKQKNSSADGIIKLTQEIGMLAQLNPNSLDKLDVDAAIDKLADTNGVPPNIIISGQKLALIRQQRAQAQQQQAALEQQAATASAMKDMVPVAESQGIRDVLADMSGGNA